MTLLICIMIGVIFAASAYLMLGGELKEICMGIFLLGHGANLAIIAASRSPIGKLPPVLDEALNWEGLADPLPQALILTAIVIGLSIQAFLLTLLVATWRSEHTLDVDQLAQEQHHEHETSN
jgi:multicomponent Na+:H+ antiporter subunit C